MLDHPYRFSDNQRRGQLTEFFVYLWGGFNAFVLLPLQKGLNAFFKIAGFAEKNSNLNVPLGLRFFLSSAPVLCALFVTSLVTFFKMTKKDFESSTLQESVRTFGEKASLKRDVEVAEVMNLKGAEAVKFFVRRIFSREVSRHHEDTGNQQEGNNSEENKKPNASNDCRFVQGDGLFQSRFVTDLIALRRSVIRQFYFKTTGIAINDAELDKVLEEIGVNTEKFPLPLPHPAPKLKQNSQPLVVNESDTRSTVQPGKVKLNHVLSELHKLVNQQANINTTLLLNTKIETSISATEHSVSKLYLMANSIASVLQRLRDERERSGSLSPLKYENVVGRKLFPEIENIILNLEVEKGFANGKLSEADFDRKLAAAQVSDPALVTKMDNFSHYRAIIQNEMKKALIYCRTAHEMDYFFEQLKVALFDDLAKEEELINSRSSAAPEILRREMATHRAKVRADEDNYLELLRKLGSVEMYVRRIHVTQKLAALNEQITLNDELIKSGRSGRMEVEPVIGRYHGEEKVDQFGRFPKWEPKNEKKPLTKLEALDRECCELIDNKRRQLWFDLQPKGLAPAHLENIFDYSTQLSNAYDEEREEEFDLCYDQSAPDYLKRKNAFFCRHYENSDHDLAEESGAKAHLALQGKWEKRFRALGQGLASCNVIVFSALAFFAAFTSFIGVPFLFVPHLAFFLGSLFAICVGYVTLAFATPKIKSSLTGIGRDIDSRFVHNNRLMRHERWLNKAVMFTVLVLSVVSAPLYAFSTNEAVHVVLTTIGIAVGVSNPIVTTVTFILVGLTTLCSLMLLYKQNKKVVENDGTASKLTFRNICEFYKKAKDQNHLPRAILATVLGIVAVLLTALLSGAGDFYGTAKELPSLIGIAWTAGVISAIGGVLFNFYDVVNGLMDTFEKITEAVGPVLGALKDRFVAWVMGIRESFSSVKKADEPAVDEKRPALLKRLDSSQRMKSLLSTGTTTKLGGILEVDMPTVVVSQGHVGYSKRESAWEIERRQRKQTYGHYEYGLTNPIDDGSFSASHAAPAAML